MYAERLQKIRKYLKLSQNEISIQCGISYRAYSSYERGERNPSFEFLEKIEKIYNINLNWLIAGDGEIFNENIINKETLNMKIENVVIQVLKNRGIIDN